jgi:hypothetical protein
MSILNLLDSFKDWMSSLGYTVVIEPTTPIDVGQVAIFFSRADIEDSAYPNQYKFTAHFELVFVSDNYQDCLEKISGILQQISPDILGEGVVVSVEGVETREKEEGEPYYAMALLLSVTYFGNEI